jgi:hypothetical protein
MPFFLHVSHALERSNDGDTNILKCLSSNEIIGEVVRSMHGNERIVILASNWAEAIQNKMHELDVCSFKFKVKETNLV